MDGVSLFELNAMGEKSPDKAILELLRLNASPRGSVHERLQKYRKYSAELIQWYGHLSEVNESCLQEIEHLKGGGGKRSRKRWTADEDDALVEMATREDSDMITLAVIFARTPGAISSRLSYLVGIKRISQEIAGHLIGYIDGEPVDGVVSGTLYREDDDE